MSVCQCWLAGWFYSLTHSPLIQCTHCPSVCVVTRSVRSLGLCSFVRSLAALSYRPVAQRPFFIHTHKEGDIQTRRPGRPPRSPHCLFLTSLSLVIDPLIHCIHCLHPSTHQCIGRLVVVCPTYAMYLNMYAPMNVCTYVCVCVCTDLLPLWRMCM